MDYAFMNALLRTTSLPAEDMWLSGFAMPYYYLGYFLLGLPAKIAGTPGPDGVQPGDGAGVRDRVRGGAARSSTGWSPQR